MSRNAWIVIAVVAAVVVLCCGGGAAFLVLRSVVEKANDTPSAIEVGEEFKHDNFVAAPGWQVAEDGSDFDIVDLTVTNRGSAGRPAFLAFTVLSDGEVVATISCSANPIGHGETGTMDCFSADDYTDDFDEVRVADTF